MRGENNPSKNPQTQIKRITDEYRKKQSDGAKGNKNVVGYRWWTDGIKNRRAKESPGNEYYLGTTKKAAMAINKETITKMPIDFHRFCNTTTTSSKLKEVDDIVI